MNERLNIRRMQVPESREKLDLPFVPMRDIAERDWVELRHARIGSTKRDTMDATFKLHVLNPALDLLIDEEEYEKVWHMGSFQGNISLHSLAKVRTVFPDQDTRPIDGSMEQQLDLVHRIAEGDDDWARFAEEVVDFRLVFPEEPIPVTNADFDKVYQWREEFRNDSPNFARISAHMRVAFPDKDLGISAHDWKNMRSTMKAYIKHSPPEGIELAYHMAIITAPEIKITKERGLQIIWDPIKDATAEKSMVPSSLQIP
jgi:hypothetical protein